MVRRGLRRYWAILVSLLSLALVGVGIAAQSSGLNPDSLGRYADQAQLLGLVVAVAVPLVQLAWWFTHRESSPDGQEKAVRILARRVLRTEEKNRYGLLEGLAAMNVQFSVAGRRAGGDLESIDQFFTRSKGRRLLITGEPGAGKTVMTLELVIRLLADRDLPDHVPVRMSLASWNTAQPFESWLAERIALDHGVPAASAQDLIESRRIVPVLDGLDEMDSDHDSRGPVHAIAAIERLNGYLSGHRGAPVVVTCREHRYAQIQARDSGLADMEHLRILPLRLPHIRKYLDELLSGAPRQRRLWDPILRQIRRQPDSTMARAMATPWRLFLAATAGKQEGALTRLSAYESVKELDSALLAAYIPSAVRPAGDRSGPAYDAAQAERWSARIARHLEWQARAPASGLSGTDLFLHLLWPIAGVRPVRWTCAVLAAVVLAAATWSFHASVDAVPGVRAGFYDILPLLVLSAFALWPNLTAWPKPSVIMKKRFSLPTGLSIGIAIGLGVGVTAGPGAGVVVGVMAGIGGGLGFTEWSAESRLPSPRSVLRGNLTITACFGLIAALAAGAVGGMTGGVHGEYDIGLRAGLLGGIPSGAGLGLAFWLISTPRFALAAGASFGLATGLSIGISGGIGGGNVGGLAIGLTFGLAVGVAFALAAGAVSLRYLTAVTFASVTGQLPFRLARFLEWAYRAGILRVSGSAYQFRHAELQRWLLHR